MQLSVQGLLCSDLGSSTHDSNRRAGIFSLEDRIHPWCSYRIDPDSHPRQECLSLPCLLSVGYTGLAPLICS